MARPVPIEHRFGKFFERGAPDDCWAWRGKIKEGRYGIVKRDGKDAYAHRVAFELAERALSEREVVRHTCDNPQCVNPAHLIAGTQADNMADMDARGRRCRGSAHHRAFLTESQIKDMKARLAGGERQATVARAFDVDPRFVGKVARGERWAHV